MCYKNTILKIIVVSSRTGICCWRRAQTEGCVIVLETLTRSEQIVAVFINIFVFSANQSASSPHAQWGALMRRTAAAEYVEPGLAPACLAGAAGSTAVVARCAVRVRRHIAPSSTTALALVVTVTMYASGGCFGETSGEVGLACGLQGAQQGTCLLPLRPTETLQSALEK